MRDICCRTYGPEFAAFRPEADQFLPLSELLLEKTTRS